LMAIHCEMMIAIRRRMMLKPGFCLPASTTKVFSMKESKST
jgi:hypothetical protein